MDSEQERSLKKAKFEYTMQRLREMEKYRREVDRVLRKRKETEEFCWPMIFLFWIAIIACLVYAACYGEKKSGNTYDPEYPDNWDAPYDINR